MANNIYQSAFISGFLLQFSLEQQPEFVKYLDIENNMPEIFIKINGYLTLRTYGEKGTVSRLNNLIEDADIIIELINSKLKE